MAKLVAKDGLGPRVRSLLDRSVPPWSIRKLAEAMDYNESTFRLRLLEDDWPRENWEFYLKLADLLKCKVTDLVPNEVRDRMAPDGQKGERDVDRQDREFRIGEPRRGYAQPITAETIALQCLGRIEHFATRLDEVEELHRLRIAELMRVFKTEMAEMRRDLLARIDHDDKGRKI